VIRTWQQQAIQTQTSDKQTVIVTVYVNWRITEAKTFYERFRKKGATEGDTIVAQAEKTLGGWVAHGSNAFAEYKLDELITMDREKFKLAAVESGTGGMIHRIREKAQEGGGYGIEIIDVGLKRLAVPDSVTAKVFERMSEERRAVVTRLVAEGNSEAASTVGKAESEATIIRAKAEADAQYIRGQGDAEAAEYYKKFLVNTELANFFRQLKTLRKTLTKRTTLILDNKSAPYRLLTDGPVIEMEKSKSKK